ncbi:MAG: DUF362 domain-containing protein [Candidatus Heimdallarchaeota archaeon]|nr:DUF362 domain-containing protein [Candidatus Heimdallarchaeota archaeon]MCK4876380.1 DUF362 domain-containing protein [Candidatus Heimdallarchaeota archaeon]
MTKISLVITENRGEGTVKAIDLLAFNPVKGKKVVLKPNFNTADPPPASTSIDTLRALIFKLQKMYARSITLAERSGPADTHECLEQKGIYNLAEELDFEIVNLAEVPLEDYVLLKPENSNWDNGFLFAKIYHEAECIVETCCLKTHQFGGHFTLSLKNATGLVPRRNLDGNAYMKELHSSPKQRSMIAEINSVFSPVLIVLDGVSVFVDGGPAKGTLKEANVMIAGTDRIAIDAVGVAILRILGTTPEVSEGSIFEQEQIARAVELKLGISSPEELEIITDSAESAELAEKIIRELHK